MKSTPFLGIALGIMVVLSAASATGLLLPNKVFADHSTMWDWTCEGWDENGHSKEWFCGTGCDDEHEEDGDQCQQSYIAPEVCFREPSAACGWDNVRNWGPSDQEECEPSASPSSFDYSYPQQRHNHLQTTIMSSQPELQSHLFLPITLTPDSETLGKTKYVQGGPECIPSPEDQEENVCSEEPSGGSGSEPVSNIPIDPDNGGRSIDTSALQIGDIILSTTNHPVSKAIKSATDSPVSHTILYIGNGQVIESVGGGARLVPIETALADSNFAVAARYPGLTHDQALQIRDFAGKQLDKKYDGWGIVKQAKFRLGLILGQAICPDVDPELFRNALATIELGTGTNDQWFCSELVLASYAAAGVPLTKFPPHWTAPGDIIPLILNGNLEYVGHLKTP